MVAAAEQEWAFYISRCTDQHISMMESQLTIHLAITFRDVPSSIRATVPSTLTCMTSPLLGIRQPISQTSRGSLSPLVPVLGSTWSISSHVWGKTPYSSSWNHGKENSFWWNVVFLSWCAARLGSASQRCWSKVSWMYNIIVTWSVHASWERYYSGLVYTMS